MPDKCKFLYVCELQWRFHLNTLHENAVARGKGDVFSPKFWLAGTEW